MSTQGIFRSALLAPSAATPATLTDGAGRPAGTSEAHTEQSGS